jgi:hypothetical protein
MAEEPAQVLRKRAQILFAAADPDERLCVWFHQFILEQVYERKSLFVATCGKHRGRIAIASGHSACSSISWRRSPDNSA